MAPVPNSPTVEQSNRPRQRRFWQIHLSTLVVLVLVAAMVLWANMQQQAFHDVLEGMYVGRMRGFPYTFWYVEEHWDLQTQIGSEQTWRKVYTGSPNWLVWHLVLDAVVAVGILSAVACYCEWLIRTRSRILPFALAGVAFLGGFACWLIAGLLSADDLHDNISSAQVAFNLGCILMCSAAIYAVVSAIGLMCRKFLASRGIQR